MCEAACKLGVLSTWVEEAWVEEGSVGKLDLKIGCTVDLGGRSLGGRRERWANRVDLGKKMRTKCENIEQGAQDRIKKYHENCNS